MMKQRAMILLSLCLSAAFAACSRSGDGSVASLTQTTGSVYVVVDTATGRDGIVQFQVGAAVFKRLDGTTTGNVLAIPSVVTFTDPSGELSGLQLKSVPTGEYDSLHLMLVPGSGTVLFADGSRLPLTSNADLEIPIADRLQHDATSNTWLAVGHNFANTVLTTGTGLVWSPQLSGRIDGSTHEVDGLRPLLVDGDEVITTLPTAGDGVLYVEFAPTCTFADVDGPQGLTRAQFLRDLDREDDLRVIGEVRRDGRCVAEHARVSRRNDGPRLLGRIVELRPASTSFVLRVLAETRRGDRRRLDPPIDVLVMASDALIHRPNTREFLAFEHLLVGDLAKVKVRSRTEVPGGLTEIVASEIEVPRRDGEPLRPEWQGQVQAVDLATRTIVVQPRGEPIVINGESVPFARVRVGIDTPMQRRERNGPGRTAITLEQVVAGQDRIWWRGTVTGPATTAATWVRVRHE